MLNILLNIAVLVLVYLVYKKVDSIKKDVEQIKSSEKSSEAINRIKSIVDKYGGENNEDD